jgi:hemoglobin-like flavoprotein
MLARLLPSTVDLTEVGDSETRQPRELGLKFHSDLLRNLPANLFTFFGAALGFCASEFHDHLQARRSKKAFLQAVGMELDALATQLNLWHYGTMIEQQNVTGNAQTGPTLQNMFGKAVYTSQVGKLRDLNNPLLLEVAQVYSNLSTLESFIEGVNEISTEFNRADIRSGQQNRVRPRLTKALSELLDQSDKFRAQLTSLNAKLRTKTSLHKS